MAPPRCTCLPGAPQSLRPRSTAIRGYPGAYDNYHQLPDADRWHQAIRYLPCRLDAHHRTRSSARLKYPNFHLHLAAPWTNAAERDGKTETSIERPTTYRLDFVIAGTGYSGDLASRPELRDFADQILLLA